MKKLNIDILQTLSHNIKLIRKQKNWSQEKLAEMCDLHRTYIGAIERAERNITLRTLEVIASALEVDAQFLLTKSTETDSL